MSTEVAEPANSPRWLSRKQAAVYLGVSVRWMRRAVEQGLFPAHKRNRLVIFRVDQLDAYMKANEIDRSDEG